MNSEQSSPVQPAPLAASHRVSLSPYVNERFPNWEELLSAHDVARLTRRPRWLVLSLTLLGRFPRKRRYHGRGVGWLRSDVIHWLTRDLRTLRCNAHSEALRTRGIRQLPLPLERTRARTQRRRR
jgi:predicted DNA-binding transcriptional regulator AlpA